MSVNVEKTGGETVEGEKRQEQSKGQDDSTGPAQWQQVAGRGVSGDLLPSPSASTFGLWKDQERKRG